MMTRTNRHIPLTYQEQKSLRREKQGLILSREETEEQRAAADRTTYQAWKDDPNHQEHPNTRRDTALCPHCGATMPICTCPRGLTPSPLF